MGKKLRFIKIFIIAVSAGYLLSGCGPFFKQPLKTERARLGPETPLKSDLMALPVAQDKIVAAVYKFSDQTGQYKPSELGNNWSTAVTQGATAILLRALEESNWFVVIERENLANLLNERKIIRSSRAQYMGTSEENSPLLPPLLFAGVILEGGIISYETNILTGGAGLRYFGAGGSAQYREDRVSIYLRAVSTSNGKVLKTVYTTKSILSQQIGFNFFRYVKLNTLMEAEVGFTYNEPSELAVTEAIEKAVISLVYEGIKDDLWKLSNPADTSMMQYVQYFKEKEKNYQTDEFGSYLSDERRGFIGAGIHGGIEQYNGDVRDDMTFTPYLELNLDFYWHPNYSVNVNLGRGTLETKNWFETTYDYAEVNLKYLVLPKANVSPFVYAGGGVFYQEDFYNADPLYPQPTQKIFPKVQGGLGVEFMIINNFSLSLLANYTYILSDKIDGIEEGKYMDYYWGGSAGLKYYFGKSPYYYQMERNRKK